MMSNFERSLDLEGIADDDEPTEPIDPIDPQYDCLPSINLEN